MLHLSKIQISIEFSNDKKRWTKTPQTDCEVTRSAVIPDLTVNSAIRKKLNWRRTTCLKTEKWRSIFKFILRIRARHSNPDTCMHVCTATLNLKYNLFEKLQFQKAERGNSTSDFSGIYFRFLCTAPKLATLVVRIWIPPVIIFIRKQLHKIYKLQT